MIETTNKIILATEITNTILNVLQKLYLLLWVRVSYSQWTTKSSRVSPGLCFILHDYCPTSCHQISVNTFRKHHHSIKRITPSKFSFIQYSNEAKRISFVVVKGRWGLEFHHVISSISEKNML